MSSGTCASTWLPSVGQPKSVAAMPPLLLPTTPLPAAPFVGPPPAPDGLTGVPLTPLEPPVDAPDLPATLPLPARNVEPPPAAVTPPRAPLVGSLGAPPS